MALGLGLAVGAGVAALVFALTDSDDPGVVSVDRPADQGVIDAAVETVTLEDRERLPPLPAQVVRRGIAPERGPLTPIAPAAATVESTDVPATSLQDPNDPRGSEDAYALFKNSRVNKGGHLHRRAHRGGKGRQNARGLEPWRSLLRRRGRPVQLCRSAQAVPRGGRGLLLRPGGVLRARERSLGVVHPVPGRPEWRQCRSHRTCSR